MNTKLANKVCRAFFIFALVLGTIFIPHQSAKAQVTTPTVVHAEGYNGPRFTWTTSNYVQGNGWLLNDVVTLTVDDPSTGQSPDYIATDTAHVASWNPNTVVIEYYLNGKINVKPGFVLAVSGGNVTKTLIVENVKANAVDPSTYIVSGIAPAGKQVEVTGSDKNNNHAIRHTVADSYSQWSVNFSVAGTQPDEQTTVQGQGSGRAYVYDVDNDGTSAEWKTVSLAVNIDDNRVHVSNWSPGALLTLTISGPDLNYSAQFSGEVFYYPYTIKLQAGDVITITDGITTITYTLAPLQVTIIDVEANTIAGSASPGVEVNVWTYTGGCCTGRRVIADESGNWVADFHNPPILDPGRGFLTGTVDLLPGSGGQTSVADAIGNETWIDWVVPIPNFDVRANYDQVEAYQWDMGNTLTITIDNPATADNPDYTATQTVTGMAPWDLSQTYLPFYLSGVYDIQTGDTVNISNGSIMKTTVVTNLVFTAINFDMDLVSGVAAPGSHVDIWACGDSNCINRHVNADQNGKWLADFANPGSEGDEQNTIDIIPGMWVDSQQNDEDGDLTMFGENVPIDSTPPTITWVGDITNGYNYYFGFVPSEPTCTADDPSGVDGSCAVTGYATTIGVHTLTAIARDMAGNVATETKSYTVIAWTLKGFYQPVDMGGVYNVVKGGSTVPMKFEIFAGSVELVDISYVRSLTYAQTSCNANAITDEIETTATGGTSLRYADGQFIYNWKTPKSAGKCYRVTMTTIDGSTLMAYFKLK